MNKLLFVVSLVVGCCQAAWAYEDRRDSLTIAELRELGVRFSDNNRLTLLTTGTDKFDDMFEAIRQARHFVHLEYFNFRNDSIGNVLFTLLARKAREGVKVRAMFDSFGNSSNNRPLRRSHLEQMRAAGIEIYEFDPIVFPWLNHAYHRDHRKIVVIDGLIAYAGGMNVADYYIHGKPEFGPWRDMHMRIEGDAVIDYERIFRDMWVKVSGEWLDGPEYYPGMKKASDYFHGLKPDTTSTAGRKVIGVADRIPLLNPKVMRKSFVAAIDHAEHHIQIINPYMTLIRSVRRAIDRAIDRGVRVEIMASTKSDVPLTPQVVGYHMRSLMRRGAEIYYYNAGFHHTKVMMVDDRFCTVGSTNINSRSFSYDYEVNAFIFDREITAQLQRLFEEDKKESTLLTSENCKQFFPFKKRLVGWAGHFLDPFM